MPSERDAGLQALQQGNFAAAVPLLETACQQNVNDFEARLYLGAAYGQLGRQMDAINTITQAVQIQPANPQARYNLAIAMEQGGYREQAIQALQQALTLQPDYSKARDALQRLQGTAPAAATNEAPSGGGYGQSADAQASGSGLPQMGFGQVGDTQPAPNYGQPGGFTPPPAPGSGGAPASPGYGQPGYSAPVAQPLGGYGQTQAIPPNPYGAPAANPYGTAPPNASAAPPAANPWAPHAGSNPYAATTPPARNPYGAAPMPGAGGYAQAYSLEYAGFWLRAGAAMIDGIIVLPITFIVMFVIFAAFGSTMGTPGAMPSPAQSLAGNVALLFQIVLGWLYFALFEASEKQATPGKMALGLKVTDLDGNRIGFARATGRHFGKILSGCLFYVGFIMAGFTERKQALHDMMAGCLVVKR